MVQKHRCWWASCGVGLPKQCNLYQSTWTCLCVATRTSPPGSPFTLEVPLRNLLTGMFGHQTMSDGVFTPKALNKRQIFDDRTPTNTARWPSMLVLKWVAKRLKHVSSNIIDPSRWASVVHMPHIIYQTCLIRSLILRRSRSFAFVTRSLPSIWYAAVQRNKTSPIRHEHKRNVSSFWSNVDGPFDNILSNTRSNTTKQGAKW